MQQCFANCVFKAHKAPWSNPKEYHNYMHAFKLNLLSARCKDGNVRWLNAMPN